ncbi:unnamed protein product, partial [Owenia fusiformis]
GSKERIMAAMMNLAEQWNNLDSHTLAARLTAKDMTPGGTTDALSKFGSSKQRALQTGFQLIAHAMKIDNYSLGSALMKKDVGPESSNSSLRNLRGSKQRLLSHIMD